MSSSSSTVVASSSSPNTVDQIPAPDHQLVHHYQHHPELHPHPHHLHHLTEHQIGPESLVTSVHGVPLPQTPEDPSVLQQSHILSSLSLPPPTSVVNVSHHVSVVDNNGVVSSDNVVAGASGEVDGGVSVGNGGEASGNSAGEIQSQETSSTEQGEVKGRINKLL